MYSSLMEQSVTTIAQGREETGTPVSVVFNEKKTRLRWVVFKPTVQLSDELEGSYLTEASFEHFWWKLSTTGSSNLRGRFSGRRRRRQFFWRRFWTTRRRSWTSTTSGSGRRFRSAWATGIRTFRKPICSPPGSCSSPLRGRTENRTFRTHLKNDIA